MAENLILCSFLGICSCYDLKLKKIPGWLLYTGILLGALYWGILKMAGQVSWAALPVSLLPGGVSPFSALPPVIFHEASPKAISERTSYIRVRLEFHR